MLLGVRWLRSMALWGAFLSLVMIHSQAFAALGGDVSSIATDQAKLAASSRIVPHQLYSVYEMRTPAGTTIRQFASPAGKVFAVSWQGYAPNLRQLLGNYFDEFMSAARSRSSVRGRGMQIETRNVVFESGGHMRFVVGRAYLRSELPQGVNADAIR